ncbi:MAG: multidrug efflux RND transporter permease subunit [Planctomycetota bacterium]|nr:multidrug efflux RND transporter permease subunit [Planctomycetota bacterium]
MLSRFFIHRPIFASVVSIAIVIGGVVSLMGLPIAQYPTIAPPTVTVSAGYPGANAVVVAETVATPLEQEINGVENMIYMSSVAGNDGSYTLTVTFEQGTDVDIAQVQVQNRVQAAMPKLPEEVKRLGVNTKKQSPDFALMVSLVSPDGRYDDIYLSNFATQRLKDVLSRIPGIGALNIFGAAEYSMRIWLDPNKLQTRNLTTSDVVAAVREQNVQVAAGAVGAPPSTDEVAFQLTVNTLGRLRDVEQFENIIVKRGEEGRITRLKDVARVEMGAENYKMFSQLDGEPAATILLYQLPGANMLDLASEVKATLADMSRSFPEGVEYVIAYDASNVVVASITDIVETLLIAAGLVILTVLLFLQDFRTTLIPTVTIPVSLIGTFAVMALLGFSLNTLTLFGLVLAIGIVVDDAIVVVENVARNIDEGGMGAKEATEKAMEEITGPVIATTLVLLAVFVPTAFMGGMTGVMYKQFGLTIATATVFSSINALTLSPALCALLMRPTRKTRNPIYKGFNFVLGKLTSVYTRIVDLFVRKVVIALILFGGVCAGAYFGFVNTPTAFVPGEDQGFAMIDIQLPDAASLVRTREVVEKINGILAETPGLARVISIGGYSLINQAYAGNFGSFLIVFEPWDDRPPDQVGDLIVARINRELAGIRETMAMAFETPPLPGLGLTAGFDLQIQDRGGLGLAALQDLTYGLIGKGRAQGTLQNLYTGFRSNVPQLFVDIDREKVKRLDIPLQSVFDTLGAYLGSAYINDFNKFGRTYKVYLQADSKFRAVPNDIKRLRVRSNKGAMIPLGTLLDVRRTFGPPIVTRYNVFPAASIKGAPAPGFSSGQALAVMEDMARENLPNTMGYEWTGVSYQEKRSGSQAIVIFALAIVFVYLVLAAQYESWSIPWSVILAVPMGVLGAFVLTMARGYTNNVYTQVGLVLLVGLVCKNSILIVEFAKEKRDSGSSVVEAALEAARLRFRPILMTALSFVLGTLPLLMASGAGAGSRKALGTAVFGGMVVATVLGVLLTPAIYRMIQGLSERVFSRGK